MKDLKREEIIAEIKDCLKLPEVMLEKVINRTYISKDFAVLAMDGLFRAVKLLENLKK